MDVKIKIMRAEAGDIEINNKAPEKCALYRINNKAPEKCALYIIKIKYDCIGMIIRCIFYKSLKYKEFRKIPSQTLGFLPKYYIKFMYDYMKRDFEKLEEPMN